jgi:hypothetical protein
MGLAYGLLVRRSLGEGGRLTATGYGLRTTGYRLRATGYGLPSYGSGGHRGAAATSASGLRARGLRTADRSLKNTLISMGALEP